MNFFDQVQAALEAQQQTLEGTLQLMEPQTATTSASTPEQIALQPRTKTLQNTFIRRYLKAVMAQPPNHQKEKIYLSTEEVMNVHDYMKTVRSGWIPKGYNHQQIEELAKMPHGNLTKVIVLTYDTRKPQQPQEQHKST